MSDTPRTDAAAKWIYGHAIITDWSSCGGGQCVVAADFSRTLERELTAVTAERDALLAAIRQQWELLPLLPTAPPGSYARGYDSGMRDTLTAINKAIAASKPAPERCTYPECECPFDAPADPNWCARGLSKEQKPWQATCIKCAHLDRRGPMGEEWHCLAVKAGRHFLYALTARSGGNRRGKCGPDAKLFQPAVAPTGAT